MSVCPCPHITTQDRPTDRIFTKLEPGDFGLNLPARFNISQNGTTAAGRVCENTYVAASGIELVESVQLRNQPAVHKDQVVANVSVLSRCTYIF